MGRSSSIHCFAKKVKSEVSSVPFLGSIVKEPGKGGPFVTTATEAKLNFPLAVEHDKANTIVDRTGRERLRSSKLMLVDLRAARDAGTNMLVFVMASDGCNAFPS
jgi:hypothetical protein